MAIWLNALYALVLFIDRLKNKSITELLLNRRNHSLATIDSIHLLNQSWNRPELELIFLRSASSVQLMASSEVWDSLKFGQAYLQLYYLSIFIFFLFIFFFVLLVWSRRRAQTKARAHTKLIRRVCQLAVGFFFLAKGTFYIIRLSAKAGGSSSYVALSTSFWNRKLQLVYTRRARFSHRSSGFTIRLYHDRDCRFSGYNTHHQLDDLLDLFRQLERNAVLAHFKQFSAL